MADVHTKKQRSYNMSQIRSKNTKPELIISKNGFRTTRQRSNTMTQIKSNNTIAEILLRKALWKLGYRYTLKNNKIKGKPDIVLPKYNTVIFVDGDFWHGYRWKWRKPRLKNNRKYWINKIEGNMKRDKKINKKLTKNGWKVIRIWEHSVKNKPENSLLKITKKLVLKIKVTI